MNANDIFKNHSEIADHIHEKYSITVFNILIGTLNMTFEEAVAVLPDHLAMFATGYMARMLEEEEKFPSQPKNGSNN